MYPTPACGKRFIGELDLFETLDQDEWETEYKLIMEKKYQKNTRRFSKQITGKPGKGEIFCIPRVRGGPSYKMTKVEDYESDDIQYCPISKGFSMQNVSSFTLGPFPGHGLCLVNAAFSKIICIHHLEGGQVDLKRKCFWKPNKNPKRIIEIVDYLDNDVIINVTVNNRGQKYLAKEWLKDNMELWFDEWDKWRKTVALCSRGDFHWDGGSDIVGYWTPDDGGKFLHFIEWKKECYIKPSLKLLPEIDVMKFLKDIHQKGIPIGLVHPKAVKLGPEKALDKKELYTILNSPYEMMCQPYVVAACLLNIEIK